MKCVNEFVCVCAQTLCGCGVGVRYVVLKQHVYCKIHDIILYADTHTQTHTHSAHLDINDDELILQNFTATGCVMVLPV